MKFLYLKRKVFSLPADKDLQQLTVPIRITAYLAGRAMDTRIQEINGLLTTPAIGDRGHDKHGAHGRPKPKRPHPEVSEEQSSQETNSDETTYLIDIRV